MASYDVHGVFEHIPEILKMELSRRGDHWEGGYYLNGERHLYRRDKFKVTKWKNDVWLHEEGGESRSITRWLMEFGGAEDYWDAVRMLRLEKSPIVLDRDFRSPSRKIELAVDPEVLKAAKLWERTRCPLYTWMVSLFGKEEVDAAWDLFNVTTDQRGHAVFWFVSPEGKILHDKRMTYLPNGHRDKDANPSRYFQSAKGYTGRCYFGANLWVDEPKVYCCESEKTALLFYLRYKKPVMAAGGKNALHEADPRLILLPDMDARSTWSARGSVAEWWKHYPDIGDHDDIGDAIARDVERRKRKINLHNEK